VSTTRPRVILVALLVAAAGLGACSKKSKKESEPTKEPAVDQTPVSDDLRKVLEVMPRDSDQIVGVDIAKLRGSEFYKAYEKQLQDLAGKQLKLLREACGIDPVAKISRAVLSAKGDRRKGDMTAIVRGLDRAETLTCLGKSFPDIRITVDGDYAMIEQLADAKPAKKDDKAADPKAADPKAAEKVDSTAPADKLAADPAPVEPPVPAEKVVKDSLSLIFTDDTTMVVARRGGKAADKPTMESIVALPPEHSVTGSPAFMQMLDQIDTDADLWFLINGNADSYKESAVGQFIQHQAAFGHVRVTSGITVDATLRLESESKAAELAKRATDQIARLRKSKLKEALGVIEFDHAQNDVRVHAEQTRPQMDALIEQAALYLAFF
jgi:hypothetical protein